MKLDNAIKFLDQVVAGDYGYSEQFRLAMATVLEYVAVARKIDPTALDRFMKSLQQFVDNYIHNFLYQIVENNDEISWSIFKTVFDRNQGEYYPGKVIKGLNESITPAEVAYRWLMDELDMEELYDVIRSAVEKVVNVDK